jgi:hypothetical protein
MKQLVINETELEDTAEVIYYMNSSARNVFDSAYSLAHDMRHYAHAVYSEEKGNVHYFSTYGYVITIIPAPTRISTTRGLAWRRGWRVHMLATLLAPQCLLCGKLPTSLSN